MMQILIRIKHIFSHCFSINRNLVTLFISASLYLAIFSTHAYSKEYVFIKDDTLWSLSKRYFKNPYDWPLIKNLDGSEIEDIYRIPIGHPVQIPDHIIKHEKINSLEVDNKTPSYSVTSVISKRTDSLEPDSNSVPITEEIIHINSSSSKALINNHFHYLILTKKTGLVRAFIDDKHVTISIPVLIQKIKSARPDIKVMPIGDGIAISTDLVKEILGIK
jgi:hypothetical protein